MPEIYQKIFQNILLAALIGVLTTAAIAQDPASNQKDYVEVIAKVLSIDPIKGDVSLRLEFEPHGNFAKDDGTLARNVKFDVNSSNGKQEISFDKGKRMTPTESVLNMYDTDVTRYPFDTHKAALIFWFTSKPEKSAEKPKPATEESAPDETKPEAKPDETEDGEVDIPFTLEFAPTLAGYMIETSKSKDSGAMFVEMEMTIARSPMVKFFSVFVMILMWGVSIAVLLLVMTVVFRDRKVEIAMFSFIATLIFAFVALRNSQPAVPPIGTTSDYVSFFWAEVILALSLLTIIFTWLLRPPAK